MIARIFHLEVLGQYGLSKIQPTTGAWSEWQRNVHDQSDSKNFNSTIDSIVKTQWRKQSGNPSSSQRSQRGQWTRKGPVPSQGEEPKSQRAKDAKAKDAKSETKKDWAVREWADVRSNDTSGVMKQNTLNRMGEIDQLQSS